MKLSLRDKKELSEFAAGRETLPFIIRVARTEQQLKEICNLRAAAYGAIDASLGKRFSLPDALDYADGTVILFAQDKRTGHYVSTARMCTNANRPLPLQTTVQLPRKYDCQHIAEVTRMASTPNYGFRVNIAMFKSLWMLCWAKQVQTLFGAARDHVRDAYVKLGFESLFDGAEFCLPYGGDLPHRILTVDIVRAENKWAETNHILYDFFVKTFHPDIEIFNSVNTMWSTPRIDRISFLPSHDMRQNPLTTTQPS